jgi:hypothetical protein
MTVSCIIQIVLILKDEKYQIILETIIERNYAYEIYISLFLFILSLIFLIWFNNLKIISFFLSFLGVMDLFYIFYFSLPNDAPFYINAVPIIIIYITIHCFLLVFSFFIKQVYLISLGLTTKEYDSIRIFQSGVSDGDLNTLKEGRYNLEKITNIGYLKRILNLFSFLIKPISKSLFEI